MRQPPSLLIWKMQIERVVWLLNLIRVVILVVVLVYLFLAQVLQKNGAAHWYPQGNQIALYIWWAVYAAITLFTFAHPDWQRQKRNAMPNASAVVDISMMAVLAYLMGGIPTGFGILTLPFLATSCLLSYGRYALLYSGYAASLLLLETFWRYDLGRYGFDAEEIPLLFNQAVLMAAYYVVPIFTAYAAKHLMRADFSVREHRLAYNRISHLAQIVTNRMQEAAIVLDKERQIWLLNRQATHYFPQLKVGQKADFLSPLTNKWQSNILHGFETSIHLGGQMMYVRAIPLIQQEYEFLTLFLRAQAERNSEAQTVKLASLGQLTANLAHEIRNPLSAMRQASGLLGEMESDNPTTQKLCGIIEKNIGRIDKMIEDVSALNKRDKINSEEIDLRGFLKEFTAEFTFGQPEKQSSLKIHVPLGHPPLVRCDAMHLQQIMWNLCHNAWRHSSQTRHCIKISIGLSYSRCIALRVWDDGAGVPESFRDKLFEPFATTQAHAGGTGLGLYVARELAHANRGDLIYVAKDKLFELTLPRVHHDQEP